MLSFSSYWPAWPSGKEGSTLVLVDVQIGVDELFQVIFGASSTFQVRDTSCASRVNCHERYNLKAGALDITERA